MKFILGQLRIFLLVCLSAAPVVAADYTTSNGKLSDRDFYKAIACKAAKNGRCKTNLARWTKTDGLAVGLVGVQGMDRQSAYARAADRAIGHAVKQINKANSRIRMVHMRGKRAKYSDIRVYLVRPVGPERIVRRTLFPLLDGQPIVNAKSATVPLRNVIFISGIGIATDRVKRSKLKAIMLEEIVQSLGLTWDIDNPYYNEKSIFAQADSDSVTTLTGQDATVLRMHYPR